MSEPRKTGLSALAMALIASLVINALLVGLMIGGSLGKHDDRHRGHRGGGDDFMIARELQSIVPESRNGEIRQAFREAFMQSRGQWREKREARQAMVDAISAKPFEQAALDQAFARMRRADEALTRNFQETLVTQIADLSDAERSDLATWLEEVEQQRRERREDRRGRRGEGPPPPRD